MPTPELIQTWILPALLGLGLAAATGLRTFLPLLLVSAAARFDVFGLDLHDKVAWLESTPALIALAAATVIELVADKVPILDHGLSRVSAHPSWIAMYGIIAVAVVVRNLIGSRANMQHSPRRRWLHFGRLMRSPPTRRRNASLTPRRDT